MATMQPSFLERTGVYSDAPTPDLVLLDLDLGTTNGLDLLATIRKRYAGSFAGDHSYLID